MFTPVDIQEELIRTRQKHERIFRRLTEEVQEALKQGKQADEYIVNRLRSTPKPGKTNINPDLLEKSRIFSIDDIKTICIQYRLRFLDSKYFKMEELPYDAVTAVKKLEKHLGEEVNHLKIMGAAKFFKLQDRNKDPLLFARIDESNYYLIHKWGKDLKWYNISKHDYNRITFNNYYPPHHFSHLKGSCILPNVVSCCLYSIYFFHYGVRRFYFL
jgi:hypothetical protein